MESLPENWRWKLRLFASADLVGSTAYKAATSAKQVPTWASTFIGFFRDFPDFVDSQYAKVTTKPSKLPNCENRLKPWKFLGDEILFTVELTNHTQAPAHLSALMRAIAEFPTQWQEKNLPLGLKGTAWLAGFPVTNREIEIHTATGITTDYIGPAVDLGFRITKFSDERRLILSVDLAMMTLDALHELEIGGDSLQLHLHGRESLKGVIENRPYPVVWLDMGDKDRELEEKLLGTKRETNQKDLLEYLRKFIDKTPKLIRPFIVGDTVAKYQKIEDGFDDLRAKMMAEEDERGFLTNPPNEEPTTKGDTNPPKAPDPSPKKKKKK